MSEFESTHNDDGLKPHDNPRRSRRRKSDRGLPSDDALRELARTYLTLQRKLWTSLAKAGALPAPTAKAVDHLAAEFRDRFLAGDVAPAEHPAGSELWQKLAAAYLRYSCDNSNPRSLDQQLKNVLERAARDGMFIPWAFVFADAAVSGTTADRTGYQMAKAAVRLDRGGPRCMYIDEIGRASRDAIEALRLGRLIEDRRKRMVGVTDGFDSDVAMSKMMLQMFAMVHEWFVDQLRAKVNRGMRDGFACGNNLGKAAVGYRLVPRTGDHGRPVVAADGAALMRKEVDETQAAHVREAFRLFAVEGVSKEKIARWFNELGVGGLRSWDARSVRQMLSRQTYAGVEYYGVSYHTVDPETGEITVHRRPEGDWQRREVPELRIVTDELWAAAQARLAACRQAYAKRVDGAKREASRTTVYPTVLVRPVCGYCGNELWLGRSGKYASFCCLNGSARKQGCGLTTYKTVAIVERAVVDHVRQAVFTSEAVADLVAGANAHLAAEGRRPKGDVKTVRDEKKEVEKKRDRLLELFESGGGKASAVTDKLKQYEERLKKLTARVRELEAPDVPLTPVTVAEVEAALADLPALLNGDTAVVAPILSELTGPVTVTQEKTEGKRGAVWMAKFTANMVPVVARLARGRNCPTSGTWEYLSTRGWKSAKSCVVSVDFVPKCLKLADEVKRLADGGAALTAIATALGQTYDTVRNALAYARNGVRPKTKPAGRPTGTRTGPPGYQAHSGEVARLRDEERMAFSLIAMRIGLNEATVRRAYRYAHRDDVRDAVLNGRPVRLGRYVRVPMAARRDVRARLDRGESVEAVSAATGCSVSTVRRIAKEG